MELIYNHIKHKILSSNRSWQFFKMIYEITFTFIKQWVVEAAIESFLKQSQSETALYQVWVDLMMWLCWYKKKKKETLLFFYPQIHQSQSE